MKHDHRLIPSPFMKFFVPFIFCLFNLNSIRAQNLVPNQSFEEYRKLPIDILGEKIDSFILGWTAPTYGTPDYFHLKTNSSTVKPPFLSLFFKQNYFDELCNVECYPKTGDAFTGFSSGFNLLDHKDTFWGNEYLQTELREKLKKNHKYRIRFNIYNLACNQLNLPEVGIFLSSFKPTHNYIPDWSKPFDYKIATNFLQEYFSQVTTGVIASTDQWVLVEKGFKSVSEEQYVTIGNFSQRNFSIMPRDSATERNGSYYFIDDISVMEIPGIIAPDSVCAHQKTELQSGFAGPFSWYKNNVLFSTDSIVYVSDSVSNWYQLHTPYGKDSLYVVIKLVLQVTAMNDTTLCKGLQMQLMAVSNANSISWYYKNEQVNPLVDKDGTYTVIAEKDGCITSDSVTITSIKLPEIIISNQQICTVNKEKADIRLPTNYFYYWPQFNDSAVYRDIDSAGCYSLTINDVNNCTSSTDFCVEDICSPKVFVPNAFAPDGVNKTFKPVFNYIDKVHWEIYNRWGQLVFNTDDLSKAWDGTQNGQPGEIGLYIYKITYSGINGKEQTIKGTVTLLR